MKLTFMHFSDQLSYRTGRNGCFYILIKISYAAKKEQITGVGLENK